MKARNLLRLAVVTGIAAWIANLCMAQQGNSVLARAFPAKLLVSKTSCTTPAWPLEARRYEIEGVTLLHFRIGEDGAISEVRVAGTSSWKLLDDAALDSVRKCKFKPGLGGEREQTYPIQFVWTFAGPPSVRPQLIEGSCAPSTQFSKFQPLNRNATGRDGVLLRFLVNAKGEPFGVKAEASGAYLAAGAGAAEYVKTCRFAVEPGMTDTVFGRVLTMAR